MIKKKMIHGIDLMAPNGIEMLMDFHRATFGNATMHADGTESTDVASTTVTVDNKAAEGEKTATAESVNDDKITDWKAEAEKWKSLSRKNEDKAKSNITRLTELESKATQLEADSEAYKTLKVENLNLLKKIVAVETGIPEGFIPRMQGSTAEELRADAEELKAMFPAMVKKTVSPVTLQGTDQADNKFEKKTFSSYEEHQKYLNQTK